MPLLYPLDFALFPFVFPSLLSRALSFTNIYMHKYMHVLVSYALCIYFGGLRPSKSMCKARMVKGCETRRSRSVCIIVAVATATPLIMVDFGRKYVCVRINATDTSIWQKDLAEVIMSRVPHLVMVPKVLLL